jgi:GTP-binding protein HflX
LKLGGGVHALLSDTVGFIRRLPHNLVGSFHATLEEARTADLLLHVADVSSPLVRGQIDAVNSVLKEIGADDRETMMVFNKVDAVPEDLQIDYKLLKQENPEAISVSALRSEGLERLKTEIRERARNDAKPLTIAVHAGDGKTLSFLATHFFEDSREMKDESIIIEGRASRSVLEKLLTTDANVRILKGWPVPDNSWK